MKVKYVQPGQRPMSANVGGGFGGMDSGIKKQLFILGGLALLVGLALWMWLGGDDTEAKESPPTPAPVIVQTVAPLPSPNPAGPTWTPTTPLEPIQIEQTATAHALYSRPVVVNPASMPYLVGVITYEPGCGVSNLGFTTAGMEGTPYYLYFQAPLDRDPLMQMVNVQGYTQRFEDCLHPVLMVQQIYWLADVGTPSPLGVNHQAITQTITGTVAAPAWGSLPTPNKYHTPVYNPPSWTPTVYPTYTPFPTATPYVPPPPSTRIVYVTRDDPDPTHTPTRTPTATATPVTVSIYGDVVTIVGCPYTNLAVSNGQQNYFIELAGAALPAGNPADYWGMVSGRAATICDSPAIRASQIIWYDPPATATPTNTPTITPTPTNTPTIEATEVITS